MVVLSACLTCAGLASLPVLAGTLPMDVFELIASVSGGGAAAVGLLLVHGH